MNKISWCDKTWNPIQGCSKVSAGCDHCWAERMARPHYHSEFPNGWDGHVKLFPERLEQPLHWRKPQHIAVALMGDLFHEAVPDEFIEDIFATMANCNHTFRILTKRPERMLKWMQGEWRDTMIEGRAQKQWHDRTGEDPSLWLAVHLPLPNVWIGISIEDQKTADERIPMLLQTPAAIRFVSAEPLLGPIDLDGESPTGLHALGCGYESGWENCPEYAKGKPCMGIDWLIVGGESGPGARPMHPDWARSLRDQCQAAGVPFHFKQWGEWREQKYPQEEVKGKDCRVIMPDGQLLSMQEVMGDELEYGGACMHHVGKKAAGRMLDGREWLEFPKGCQ